MEIALEQDDDKAIDLAIGRILLIHGIIFAYGGIPTLYMGDEIGMLNDYGYVDEPEHRDDSRWLHRPKMDWNSAETRHAPKSIAARIFQPLKHLLTLRK